MLFGRKPPKEAPAEPPGGDGVPPGADQDGPPRFDDKDKARARQWFKKGDDCREKHDHDFAIESYITGLGFWPEAVEEGHMKLRSIAMQRLQAGGKKPSMMDKMKLSIGGKDPKAAMLNAEKRVSLDPTDDDAWDALLKNACKARMFETAKWVAPLVLENLKRDKKTNPSRFKAYRDALGELADYAAEHRENATATKLLEHAMDSVDFLYSRSPGDEALRNEQRNLAGKLAIVKGKYEEAESFRESIRDAEQQKMLHDIERGGKQAEASLESAIKAARAAWEKEPNSAGAFNQYIDALARTETKKYEDEAIGVLTDEYASTRQYAHKVRADNILLAQKNRERRALVDKARETRSEEDQLNARLADQEYNQTELEIYRERMDKYPTDLRVKFKLGTILFSLKQYDEAIPLLQEAVSDPKYRHRCQLYMGRAFHALGSYGQASEVLKEALSSYEYTDDLSKQLLYHYGISCEADERLADAKDAYGKLLRLDYNYANGDVRRRMDELNKRVKGAAPSAEA